MCPNDNIAIDWRLVPHMKSGVKLLAVILRGNWLLLWKSEDPIIIIINLFIVGMQYVVYPKHRVTNSCQLFTELQYVYKNNRMTLLLTYVATKTISIP